MELKRQQLDAVLDALGQQLAVRGTTAQLVVIGGSGLLALGVVDRATQDVDVVALMRDGELVTAEPLPEAVVAAAERVAQDFALIPGWLNAGPTPLLEEAGGLPAGFRDRVDTRQYGAALTIHFAGRVDQIYLKLYALADRGEARDAADLEALAPTESELHAAARWARSHNMPGDFDQRMAGALASLGVEDVGRDA